MSWCLLKGDAAGQNDPASLSRKQPHHPPPRHQRQMGRPVRLTNKAPHAPTSSVATRLAAAVAASVTITPSARGIRLSSAWECARADVGSEGVKCQDRGSRIEDRAPGSGAGGLSPAMCSLTTELEGRRRAMKLMPELWNGTKFQASCVAELPKVFSTSGLRQGRAGISITKRPACHSNRHQRPRQALKRPDRRPWLHRGAH